MDCHHLSPRELDLLLDHLRELEIPLVVLIELGRFYKSKAQMSFVIWNVEGAVRYFVQHNFDVHKNLQVDSVNQMNHFVGMNLFKAVSRKLT